jgi:hypothetical protein
MIVAPTRAQNPTYSNSLSLSFTVFTGPLVVGIVTG